MSDCIPTHLSLDRKGYGQVGVGSRTDGTRRKRGTHRIAYAEHHGLDVDGPEMKGMDIDHTCFNPACVNVEHLDLVPHGENMRRSAAAGRMGKLTPYAVMWIRSYVQEGWPRKDVADMFGVTQQTVGHIIRRRTWKHVA